MWLPHIDGSTYVNLIQYDGITRNQMEITTGLEGGMFLCVAYMDVINYENQKEGNDHFVPWSIRGRVKRNKLDKDGG